MSWFYIRYLRRGLLSSTFCYCSLHFGPFTLSFECESLSVPAGRLQAKTSPPDPHTILPHLTFNLITDCNPLYGLSAVLKLCLHPSMKTFLSGLCSPWMRLRAFYYVSILRSLFEMEISVWVYYWLFHYLPSLKKRVTPPEKLSNRWLVKRRSTLRL